jgi:hypothetical protein
MLGWNGPVCFHAHAGVSEEPPTTINRYAVWLDRPEILTTGPKRRRPGKCDIAFALHPTLRAIQILLFQTLLKAAFLWVTRDSI